ncbi:MAG: hypothetical protein AB7Q16_25385 [Vicinamibacterales bacterium]
MREHVAAIGCAAIPRRGLRRRCLDTEALVERGAHQEDRFHLALRGKLPDRRQHFPGNRTGARRVALEPHPPG